MANAYDSAEIATSSKDRARMLLGDLGALKDPDGAVIWLYGDTEIAGMIAAFGFAEGVAQMADGLAVRFAQEPDQYEDQAGVKVVWGERVKAWRALAANLRSGVMAGPVTTPPTRIGTAVTGVSLGPDMTRYR